MQGAIATRLANNAAGRMKRALAAWRGSGSMAIIDITEHVGETNYRARTGVGKVTRWQRSAPG
jgi:hypothetical protein